MGCHVSYSLSFSLYETYFLNAASIRHTHDIYIYSNRTVVRSEISASVQLSLQVGDNFEFYSQKVVTEFHDGFHHC